MSDRDLGRVAYEAYLEASNYRSLVSGEPLPTWHAQSALIRQAWNHAADAVVRRSREQR